MKEINKKKESSLNVFVRFLMDSNWTKTLIKLKRQI